MLMSVPDAITVSSCDFMLERLDDEAMVCCHALYYLNRYKDE